MFEINKLPKHLIRNSSWHTHYNLLRFLIFEFKPKKIVELGTWYGFSYFSMCEIVRELQLEKNNAKCFGVDHWGGDEHAGLIDAKEAFEFVNKINQEYIDFSKLVKKTFNDAKKDFNDHSIDFIHFDGRHYYEDIKEDFNSYLEKINENAIAIFHDTNVTLRNFGIKKFFEEISTKYSCINFKHDNGLGVIFFGEKAENIKKKIINENLDEKFRIYGETSKFYIKQMNPNDDDIEQFNDQIVSAEVYLRLDKDREKENKITEIKLHVPGKDLFAKKQCKSFEEATNVAVEALRRQIMKGKSR